MRENYPVLEINLSAIYHNAKIIVEKGKENGILIDGVTKVSLGDPNIGKALIKAGVRGISDSRVESIKRMKRENLNTEFTLIRIPSLSQIPETVKYADISLNSELKTIEELNNTIQKEKKRHKIIIMVEMGDLREGIWDKSELREVISTVLKMKNIELVGIGTNFTCFGGVIPTQETYMEFSDLIEALEKEFSINFQLISAGNSSSIPLLFDRKIPKKINHLRIGEGIMLGKDTAFRNPIPGARLDTFKLIGEIVERKEKPSLPWGIINEDAFGHKPTFKDKGIRKRALLNFGRQDIDPDGLKPNLPGIDILGSTSDYTVIDLGEHDEIKVGDTLSFSLNYSALLQAFTSPFIKKIYKEVEL
ncbi:MAG: alanine/ornithine racemase family PLP-dependent enzyme [Dictyoglomaceae bacterium]